MWGEWDVSDASGGASAVAGVSVTLEGVSACAFMFLLLRYRRGAGS
jgi:hypothetical protein